MNGDFERYVYATFKLLGTTVPCLPVGDNLNPVI